MINTPKRKLVVLFVGGFTKARDGAVGGQLHACDTLINSKISGEVDFILVDSTMESLPPPPLYRRAYVAIKRIIEFIYDLCR